MAEKIRRLGKNAAAAAPAPVKEEAPAAAKTSRLGKSKPAEAPVAEAPAKVSKAAPAKAEKTAPAKAEKAAPAKVEKIAKPKAEKPEGSKPTKSREEPRRFKVLAKNNPFRTGSIRDGFWQILKETKTTEEARHRDARISTDFMKSLAARGVIEFTD
jgi:hypothetical protein